MSITFLLHRKDEAFHEGEDPHDVELSDQENFVEVQPTHLE